MTPRVFDISVAASRYEPAVSASRVENVAVGVPLVLALEFGSPTVLAEVVGALTAERTIVSLTATGVPVGTPPGPACWTWPATVDHAPNGSEVSAASSRA